MWADANANGTSSDRSLYLGVYGSIGIVLIIVEVSRDLLVFLAAATASKIIHQKLLNGVIHSPISFFDTNPTGRILNRFSEDVGKLDAMPWLIGNRTCPA